MGYGYERFYCSFTSVVPHVVIFSEVHGTTVNGFKNKLNRAIWHVPRRLASDGTPSGSDTSNRFKSSIIIMAEQQYRSVGVYSMLKANCAL